MLWTEFCLFKIHISLWTMSNPKAEVRPGWVSFKCLMNGKKRRDFGMNFEEHNSVHSKCYFFA